MEIFQPISLSYNGVTKTVQPESVLMLIATIEEKITLADILSAKPQMAKVAMGFAAALRFAGHQKVNDQQIYKDLFDKEKGASTQAILQTLLMMMLPPEDLAETPESNSGKPETDSEATAAESS